MRVAIITSYSGKSSKELADYLRVNDVIADVFKPFKDGTVNFRGYDYVFSFGCSADTVHQKRLNSPESVAICVNKVQTFKKLKRVNVPIPRYWTHPFDIPKDVEHLVVRESVTGRKAEGLAYWSRCDGDPIPNGNLFTEFYDSKRELRVTVFNGQVWVYRKDMSEDGFHIFNLTKSSVYGKIRADAVKAAKVMDIDYVSFDVLYNSSTEYVFLEANSGSVLTNEVSTAIVEFFLSQ